MNFDIYTSSDLNTYLPCGSLDPADFQHELEAPRARLSLARAVLQEIPRQVLDIFSFNLFWRNPLFKVLFLGCGIHESCRYFAQSPRHPWYSRWHPGGGFRQEIQHVDQDQDQDQHAHIKGDLSSSQTSVSESGFNRTFGLRISTWTSASFSQIFLIL